MKNKNLVIALAAGAGAAITAYSLLSRNIPKGATAIQSFDKYSYLGK